MSRLALTCLLLGAGLVAASTKKSNVSISRTNSGGVFAPGDLIFEENFDWFNHDLWHFEINMNGGYNNEFQIYNNLNENSYVKDGMFHLLPTWSLEYMFGGNYEQLYNGYLELPGCTDPDRNNCHRQAQYPHILPPVVSARLRTQGSFSFRYGRVEVRAKMPAGDWMWPAIWMLPEHSVYGQWPRSGEIDLLEVRGNRELRNPSGTHIGCEQTASTLHFGPVDYQNNWWAVHGEKNTAGGRGFDRDFHIYEVEWAWDYMRFKVDGTEIKFVYPPDGGFWEIGKFPGDIPNPWVGAENYKMAPFDQNFHLIMNVAVGGDYFPRDSNPGPPWGHDTAFLDFMNARDGFRHTWTGDESLMKVDYIRIYAI